MEKTFNLEILASDHPFYKGECEILIFPGLDGEFGILPNHEEMVTCLNAGEVRFKVDGDWKYAAVSEGFIEITHEYVVLLADTVEKPEDIDIKRAEEAEQRAKERLRQKQSVQEYVRTEAALRRATNRIRVSRRRR